MAQPDERFELAQAPIVRPDPIPRPEAIERPGSSRPNRFQKYAPPPAAARPQAVAPPANRFEKYADPTFLASPGKDATVEQAPVGSADTQDPVSRFQFKPADAPPMKADSPADMTPDQVRKILANVHPELRQAIIDEYTDAVVKRERSKTGIAAIPTWIDDRIRNHARGTPVGSWLDEANATIYGLLGKDYDMQLSYERAKDRAIDAEASTLTKVKVPESIPYIGGSEVPITSSGLEKAAGALTSTIAFPAVNLMRPAVVGGAVQPLGMAGRMVNSTATGSLYGALYGAGEGDGASERVMGGLKGFALGGALGAAVPPVQAAVTAPINAVARRFNQPGGPIANMDRNAVQKVSRSIEQDNLPATYQQRTAELGPEGMLADMGPNLRMDAGRLARNPGDARSTVVGALDQRAAGAQDRINTALDTGIGAPVPIPQTIASIRTTANAQARPHYDQFYNTPIPNDQALVTAAQRVPYAAYRRAAELADMEGYDLSNIINTGRGIDYLKRGVDDIARKAEPGSHLQTIARDLSREIRRVVDDMLSPGNPAASSWAQARAAAGTGLQFREAVEGGQRAFAKNLSPDQMRADMARMNMNQRGAYEAGARDQLHQIARNAASNFGATGDNALRRIVQTPNAQEKLEMIAGPQGARTITRRVNAETEFDRTNTLAQQNSVTSTMNAAAKKWPSPDDGAATQANLRASSLQGMAMSGAHKIINAVRNGALTERTVREQADAARMLVAQGAERDAIAAALIRFARRAQLSQQRRMAIEGIVHELLSTAPRAPILSETSGR